MNAFNPLTSSYRRQISAFLMPCMLLLALGVPCPAQAMLATSYLSWVGPDGGVWSNPANWHQFSGDHSYPQNGDSVLFDDTDMATVNDLSSLWLEKVIFTADGISISGNLLTVTNRIELAGVNLTASVNLPVKLSEDLELWSSTSGNTLIMAGGISEDLRVPDCGIIKSGQGTVMLSAADSYLGGGTVNLGTLRLSHAQAGGTGAIDVKSGATLAVGAGVFNLYQPLSLAGDGAGGQGALRFESGSARTVNGPITLNAAASIYAAGGSVTLNTATGGMGDLILRGEAQFTLTGAESNTFSGMLRVEAGSLMLNKTGGGIAVPGILNIGPVAPSTLPVEVMALLPNQFAPASVVLLRSYGRLNVNGTQQTVSGLVANSGTTGCSISLDSTTGTRGSLTVQPPDGTFSALTNCDLTGLGTIYVQGGGHQNFGDNTGAPFPGTIEVQQGEGSLTRFKMSGPYIVRAGAKGSMFGAAQAGSVIVEGGSFRADAQGEGLTPRATSLLMSGTGAEFLVTLDHPTALPMQVLGPVNLGGALLDLCISPAAALSPGQTRTIIKNESTLAVQGTFAGAAEGSITQVFSCSSGTPLPAQVSYQGGDGNDVALTLLARAALALYMTPSAPQPSESVTLQARLTTPDAGLPAPVTPVEFYDNGVKVGEAPVDASGYATLSGVALKAGRHSLTARLVGDPVYANAESEAHAFMLGKMIYLPLAVR